MINHKYLTELGMELSDITSNVCEPDSREEYWAKQRKEYGFDERETWNMNTTFYEWLYERLMMYKEKNSIDLSFHKFDYNGEEKTQGELINLMLDKLKIALTDDDYKVLDKKWDEVHEIEKIWALVLPAMWW